MSTGAVFKLIANDGKADRMIMATKLLNQRIKDVMCARNAAGKADITPTLVDLERTHILYVNAHFKPFAAIGYEYNKVRPQSGSASLGTGVTFSIPQFGDFFHDMVCRVRLTSCSAIAVKTPIQGSSQFPANVVAAEGQGPSIYYNIVDAFGNVVVAGGSQAASQQVTYQNMVQYCEYPGNRLFRWVKFDVNGNPLDAYDDMVPTMLEKFCTPPHKRAGFDRLVGQEVPVTGYTGPRQASAVDQDAALVGNLQTPPNVINRNVAGQSNQTVFLYNQAALASGSNPSVLDATCQNLNIPSTVATAPWGNFQPQFDVSRIRRDFVNGPQTPKPQQPILEIWNKLRFWFNDDVRLSIPSVSIPFGQRFISIDLCQASNLLFEFPSMYLETIIDNGVGGSVLPAVIPPALLGPTAQGLAGAATQRQKIYSPLNIFGGVTAPSVDAIELYINNIFVNPEVHDIYIKRIGFSLIRVYRQQWQRIAYGASELLLSQLKWPIEYMFIGARPQWNISAQNPLQWRDWHRLTHVVPAYTDLPSLAEAPITASGQLTSQAAWSSTIHAVVPDQYYMPVPTIDSMALTSHGIVIFDNFSDTFFNQYMPFHYGGTALCTPDDVGALFVNMALFPRSYQPSGHLNISRARETYLKWSSSYISSTSPVDFIIVAVAINFLLITDGSAVLRYST